MGLINRCKAALRFFGEDLIPEEMSRLLGHFPSKAWMKGYQYTTSSGGTVLRKNGAWILDADPSETGDFDGQVSQLLAQVPIGKDVWLSLANQFEMDLYCGWFMQGTNEGVAISPKSLLLLGERNIALSVEIYASLDDE
jgi:hypothetical protein